MGDAHGSQKREKVDFLSDIKLTNVLDQEDSRDINLATGCAKIDTKEQVLQVKVSESEIF